jgi:hypothetical protein
MPIDNMTVHLTDGIKQGDYAPNKVYDLTAFLSSPSEAEVDQAVDMIVRAGERFLGRKPTLPPTSSASPEYRAGVDALKATNTPDVGEAQRRTRRTKAEMEAARLAEIAAADAPAEPEPSPPADEAAASDDEWAVEETPAITDLELNHSCSETAGRTKKPLDIKALIGSFSPATDEYNVEKGGRKFTVNDIPQSQRADFIAKLKALS